MQADLTSTLLFTLAAALSVLLAAGVTDVTLTRKFSLGKTAAVWGGFLILYYLVTFAGYSINITDDTMAGMGLLLFPIPPTLILYRENTSSKVFVPVMASLIASVTTFFFCGTTLSFVDNTPNPYNLRTLLIFNSIKIVWFLIFFLFYRRFVSATVRQVIEVLGKDTKKYVPVAIFTFLAFFVINRLTNTLGIMPGIPETRVYFIIFYLIICSIFIILYWEIFSTALWSSRALKTEAELNVASSIQRDMLPNIFPPFPDCSYFDIYATMDPAKEVGGDFYDFFLVDKTHLVFTIADVSGKGVPAALFMVIAKTIIRNQAQSSMSPAEIFRHANNQLCENNGEGLFVTSFLGILDLKTGKLTFSNAGHNPPLLHRAGGGFEYLAVRPGFVLAGMEDMEYPSAEITPSPGDSLFLYTDGVTEAVNSKLELYGEERLLEALNRKEASGLRPTKLLPYIKNQVELFVEKAPQADDIAMLAVQFFEKYQPGQTAEG